MSPLAIGFGLRTLPGCQPHVVKTSPHSGELAEAARDSTRRSALPKLLKVLTVLYHGEAASQPRLPSAQYRPKARYRSAAANEHVAGFFAGFTKPPKTPGERRWPRQQQSYASRIRQRSLPK